MVNHGIQDGSVYFPHNSMVFPREQSNTNQDVQKAQGRMTNMASARLFFPLVIPPTHFIPQLLLVTIFSG